MALLDNRINDVVFKENQIVSIQERSVDPFEAPTKAMDDDSSDKVLDVRRT